MTGGGRSQTHALTTMSILSYIELRAHRSIKLGGTSTVQSNRGSSRLRMRLSAGAHIQQTACLRYIDEVLRIPR